MKTPDGKKMTAKHATLPVGSALRIAPSFVATAVDETTGIETTIEARYIESRGRYIITAILNRAISDDFDEERLKRTAPQAILRAAVPHCISLLIDDSPGATRTTVADLTTNDGRILPEWMARAVARRGIRDERWDAIEILYGTATLADLPAAKLVAVELDVPERTATDWIRSARAAGRLEGMTSNIGRPAGG